MAKQHDKIIVVDLEATCWRDKKPPKGQENEIIEIGVCLLDLATGERESKESILVRPERSQVSEFCTELTTLTQAQVDEGVSFVEACKYLRSTYLSRERAWASYGDYDRRQVERQCRDRKVGYPFGPTHLNVKHLLSMLHGWPREVGLDGACKKLGITLEGTHHRGHDDAWNIAALLSTTLLR